MFRKMLKSSITIPYEDISVYPSINITKDAIAKYCGQQGYEYEFLDTKEDNMQVHIDGTTYEVIRGLAERGCYGIRCREL